MASGRLTFTADGNGKGRYADLRNKFEIAFEKIQGGGGVGSDKPSHDVYGKTAGGDLTHMGAAWVKAVNDGPNKGQHFFSFYLDDPSMGGQLNLSAFPVRDQAGKAQPGEYEIVWRREKKLAA